MVMNALKYFIVAAVLFFLLCGSAPAEVKIASLPQPPPTAKLRVFVVALTLESKFTKRPVFWPVSPEEFDRKQKNAIDERLRQQGIYEVVNSRDIRTVIGDQKIAAWEWLADDCALVRKVGRALHADYALVSQRSFTIHLQFDTRFINLTTGQEFSASGYVPPAMFRFMTDDQKKQPGAEVIKIQFRQIFHDAKSDLIRTAIRKGRLAAKEPAATSEPALPPVKLEPATENKNQAALRPPKEKPEQTLPKAQVEAARPQKTAADVKISEKQLTFEKELERALAAGDKKTDTSRLVVYDFDATERMKVVGLILTEALREEFHKLGGFVLVNRENILKIMDEYKLQQTSLVDEKQAVKVGKWLAANEAVTGHLAMLGKTSILQVKRVDIKTLGTLALGSLKCPAGREDELLDQMRELARQLTQTK